MTVQKKSNGKLLSEYTELMNLYGSDSQQANAYLLNHQHNAEFLRLAATAKVLKEAFLLELFEDGDSYDD